MIRRLGAALAPREANIESVSGDLNLTLNTRDVDASSVSGDLRLKGKLSGEMAVETVSGNIDADSNGLKLRRISAGTVSGVANSFTLGNEGLKPERQREYEGGFDAAFFGDRAQLDVTYYDKLTRDLVLSVPLNPSSGAVNQFQNIGVLTNKGIEVALNTLTEEHYAGSFGILRELRHHGELRRSA